MQNQLPPVPIAAGTLQWHRVRLQNGIEEERLLLVGPDRIAIDGGFGTRITGSFVGASLDSQGFLVAKKLQKPSIEIRRIRRQPNKKTLKISEVLNK